jgi:hypothetical protein
MNLGEISYFVMPKVSYTDNEAILANKHSNALCQIFGTCQPDIT